MQRVSQRHARLWQLYARLLQKRRRPGRLRSFRRVVERESAFERFEQVGCAGEQEERRFAQ